MELFEGYVLQAELAEKANVSSACFDQIKGVKTKKMGWLVCILKDSLPFKYKIIAENECQDLGKYCSYTKLSIDIGMSESYLAQTARHKIFINKKIGHAKLFELNKEFISYVKDGLNPFKIKNEDDEECAKQIIEMQGLKIGFY